MVYSQEASFSLWLANHVNLSRLWSVGQQYIELVLISLFSLLYLSFQWQSDTEFETIVSAPQKSDFFYIDYRALDSSSDARFRYVPMKVLSVSEEGIQVRVGNIAHTKPVSPREHAKFDRAMLMRNYYRQGERFIAYETLKNLVNSGAIYAAKRPRNVYIGGWIVLAEHEIVSTD